MRIYCSKKLGKDIFEGFKFIFLFVFLPYKVEVTCSSQKYLIGFDRSLSKMSSLKTGLKSSRTRTFFESAMTRSTHFYLTSGWYFNVVRTLLLRILIQRSTTRK